MNRIRLVDYMKGLSMVAIVLLHTIYTYGYSIPTQIRKVSLMLGLGSHVFIVCSGFGLYISHLKNPVGYRDFYKKRFIKMYLPYIVIVIITASVPFIYTGINRGQALLSHIFLYKMFSIEYMESLGGQLWFISTIIQFYFSFFILIKMYSKFGGKILGIISLVISMSCATFTYISGVSEIRIWNSFFLQYIWEFVLGMIFAELYFNNKIERIQSIKPLILFLTSIICIGIYGIMAMTGFIVKQYNDIFGVIGCLSALLLFYKISSDKIIKLISSIGKFSYEWFLVHILIFEITINLLNDKVPNSYILVIMFFVSLGISIIYNKLWTKIYNFQYKKEGNKVI